MSDLSIFLNPIKEENVKLVISERFQDDTGKPVEWELKALTSEEDEKIRRRFTKTLPLKGRNGQKTPDFDSNGYTAAFVAACVVYPNLNNKELQDAYDVMNAEQLLKKMLKPGEFFRCLEKVQEINGLGEDMNELVEEAKN